MAHQIARAVTRVFVGRVLAPGILVVLQVLDEGALGLPQ